MHYTTASIRSLSSIIIFLTLVVFFFEQTDSYLKHLWMKCYLKFLTLPKTNCKDAFSKSQSNAKGIQSSFLQLCIPLVLWSIVLFSFLLIKLQWLSLWDSCLIKLHKIDWLFFSYFMLLLFLSFLQNADCLSLFTSWYLLWFLNINTISKAAAHVIVRKMYTIIPVTAAAFHFRQLVRRYPVSLLAGFYSGQ